VPHLSYYIFFSGLALEAILAYRLVGERLWRHYPLFTLYLAYVIAQSLIGFAILQGAPNSYPVWFWRSGIVHICLRFLVIWEVFRQTFPKTSPLRALVSRQSTVGALALVTVLTGMLWAIQTYGKSHSVYLAMERSFGFVQAMLILAVLTLARYYRLPVGRNIWGIAVAFGMYSSVSTAASGLVDLMRSSFPVLVFPEPVQFRSHARCVDMGSLDLCAESSCRRGCADRSQGRLRALVGKLETGSVHGSQRHASMI
jgi:hypothetical protein